MDKYTDLLRAILDELRDLRAGLGVVPDKLSERINAAHDASRRVGGRSLQSATPKSATGESPHEAGETLSPKQLLDRELKLLRAERLAGDRLLAELSRS